jgi:methionyl-tRNA synthetase
VNEYVDRHKPWELAKQAGQDAALHDVCSVCIEAFRLLTLYLKPVLPALAAQVEAFLRIEPLKWADAAARAGRAHHRRVQAPDAARGPEAARRAVRAARPRRGAAPLPGGEALAPRSASTTSSRSTCASPASSSRRARWKAAPSCCA